jgi:hypothetical protein
MRPLSNVEKYYVAAEISTFQDMTPASALPILLQNKADSRLTPYYGL